MFASSYDWYVSAIWDDEELDMTFQIPVPSGALAGTYNLYFKVTADYYDANNNRHDREVLITAEVEVRKAPAPVPLLPVRRELRSPG